MRARPWIWYMGWKIGALWIGTFVTGIFFL
jgi:hypothetical protein